MTSAADKEPHKTSNFLRQAIEKDLEQGTYGQRHRAGRPGDAAQQQAGEPDPAKSRTRLPPEPNGYLHVGHAKSICLNFGLAQEFGGRCHLRFDDTNPTREEQEFIDSIQRDVRWLGFDWREHLHFASDYFEQLYEWAAPRSPAGRAS